MPVEDILDKPIAFHRCFVDLTGSVNAALMLSQAIFWSKISEKGNKGGWFYKTSEDWEEETGLTRRMQDGARKQLRNFKFWQEDLKGVPATCHFKAIRAEVFSSLAEMSKLSFNKNAKQDCTEAPSSVGGNVETIRGTETTREYTETTRSEDSPPASGAPISFKSIKYGYPQHRMTPKNERDARREWHHCSPEEQRLISEALGEVILSPDWIKDDGRWVPTPQRFIKERLWEVVKPNHHAEVETAWKHCIEAFEIGPNVNSLTPDRRSMISQRFDDAARIAAANQRDNPLEIMLDAIDKCADTPRRKGLGPPGIETVFGSTEVFEKWVDRTYNREN